MTARDRRRGLLEQAEILRAAELAAREEALRPARRSRRAVWRARASWRRVAARLRRREDALAADTVDLDARRARLGAPKQRLDAREAETAELRRQARALAAEAPAALERLAGETAAALRARLIETEIEEARMAAAQVVRAADQTPIDDAGRRAKRIMGIAVGRFSGHYLTERLMSTLPLPHGSAAERSSGPTKPTCAPSRASPTSSCRSPTRATPCGWRVSTGWGARSRAAA